MSEVAKQHYMNRLAGIEGEDFSGVFPTRSIFASEQGVWRAPDEYAPVSIQTQDANMYAVQNIIKPAAEDVVAVSRRLACGITQLEPDFTWQYHGLTATASRKLKPTKFKTGNITELHAELLTAEEIENIHGGLSDRLTPHTQEDKFVRGSELFVLFGGLIKSSLGRKLGYVGCVASVYFIQTNGSYYDERYKTRVKDDSIVVAPRFVAVKPKSTAVMEQAVYNNSVATARTVRGINSLNTYRGGLPGSC
jgi:hypothetical protein